MTPSEPRAPAQALPSGPSRLPSLSSPAMTASRNASTGLPNAQAPSTSFGRPHRSVAPMTPSVPRPMATIQTTRPALVARVRVRASTEQRSPMATKASASKRVSARRSAISHQGAPLRTATAPARPKPNSSDSQTARLTPSHFPQNSSLKDIGWLTRYSRLPTSRSPAMAAVAGKSAMSGTKSRARCTSPAITLAKPR